MMLRRRAVQAVLAGTSAAMALVLGATTAMAATTNLQAKITHGGTYTATAAKTVLTDNGVSVTCASSGTTAASTATGSVPSGTKKGASPLKIGNVKTLVFNNCTGPLGAVTVKINKLPYSVKVDSATNSKGQTDAIISGVNASVSMTGCSFTVAGSVPGYFTNKKNTLTLTSQLPVKPLDQAQLTISNVSGCAGLVKNGDHPSLTAVFVFIYQDENVIIIIVIIIKRAARL